MFPVAILLGGKATRLGSIAEDTPKCLIKIGNHPFLHYQLSMLVSEGVESVILCLGHLSEQIVEYVENEFLHKINISYSYDGNKPLGTGGSIKKAIKGLHRPLFVMYGDSLLNVSFKKVQSSYERNQGPLMVIFENNNLFDKSNVYYSNQQICYNKLKPHVDSNYIDYGLSIFEETHFTKTTNSFDLALLHEKFSEFGNLQSYIAKKGFYEIGSLEGLTEARSKLY